MKKFFALILIIIFHWLTAQAQAADFSFLGAGGRSLALGGSGLGWEENNFGNFLNPASLAGINFINLNSVYLRIGDEVSFKALGFNLPTEWGVLSFSYLQSGLDGIYHTSLDESGRPVIQSSFAYDTNYLILGFGRNFGKYSLGAALKYNRQNLGAFGSASGYNLDCGLVYFLNESQNIGAVLRNVLPGSIGALNWSTGLKEKMTPSAGIGFKQEFEGFKILADLNLYKDLPLNFHAGAEFQGGPFLALRFGLDQVLGYGKTLATRLTLGLGVKAGLFNFDYGYLPDAFFGEGATHYLSVAVDLEEK